MLTLAAIKRDVNSIKLVADDPEVAHGREDALHMKVLIAIAQGNVKDPQKAAAEAIKTWSIQFPRWRA